MRSIVVPAYRPDCFIPGSVVILGLESQKKGSKKGGLGTESVDYKFTPNGTFSYDEIRSGGGDQYFRWSRTDEREGEGGKRAEDITFRVLVEGNNMNRIKFKADSFSEGVYMCEQRLRPLPNDRAQNQFQWKTIGIYDVQVIHHIYEHSGYHSLTRRHHNTLFQSEQEIREMKKLLPFNEISNKILALEGEWYKYIFLSQNPRSKWNDILDIIQKEGFNMVYTDNFKSKKDLNTLGITSIDSYKLWVNNVYDNYRFYLNVWTTAKMDDTVDIDSFDGGIAQFVNAEDIKYFVTSGKITSDQFQNRAIVAFKNILPWTNSGDLLEPAIDEWNNNIHLSVFTSSILF